MNPTAIKLQYSCPRYFRDYQIKSETIPVNRATVIFGRDSNSVIFSFTVEKPRIHDLEGI